MRRTLALVIATLACGCSHKQPSTTETSEEEKAPAAPAPAEQDLPWWRSATPCPEGKLVGAPHPDGTEVHCEKKDGSWHGRSAIWWANGKLKLETQFQDAVLHGMHIEYFENGAKKAEGRHHQGLRQGVWSEWRENGTMRSQGAFERDVPVGDWKRLGPDGAEIADVRDGDIAKGWWKLGDEGCEGGTFRNFGDLNHEQHAACIIDGMQHGPFAEWHVIFETDFGGHETKNEIDKKRAQGRYRYGRRHGPWTWWHDNGRKSKTGAYRNGKPVGVWSWWSPKRKKLLVIDRSKEQPSYLDEAPKAWQQEKMKDLSCPPGTTLFKNPVVAYCTWPDDVKHGPAGEWYSGKNEALVYFDGTKHGVKHEFVYGTLSKTSPYRQGKLHSHQYKWSKSGERESSALHLDGVKQ